MPSYANLIKDAQKFYAALDQNNTRDWWLENKGTYDSDLKAPALALLDEMAPAIEKVAGCPVKPKLFRPHRDVRFSKDETPYNTHLHMMWGMEAGAPQNPVFFFGIGLDYVTAGAGLMGFDKPVLENWRRFVDLDTDRVTGIVEELKSKGYGFREPALKRIPSPFDKDHPAGDLLRMKGIVTSRDLGKPKDLPAALKDAFADLAPLNALLVQVAEA